MSNFFKIFIISVFLIVCSIYFFQFHNGWGTQEHFGQFGDFLGGSLNPILTALNVYLLITYNKESKVLADKSYELARIQYSKNQLVSQLFKLLENHHNLLQNITVNEKVGSRALIEVRRKIEENINQYWDGDRKEFCINGNKVSDYKILKKSYLEFYQKSGKFVLENYFMNIYSIYDFIENNSKVWSPDEQKAYGLMISNQLSFFDRELIFLHCLTFYSFEYVVEFRKYAREYKLFDNLLNIEFENDQNKKIKINVNLVVKNETWYNPKKNIE